MKTFILSCTDKYKGKWSLPCAARSQRSKLVRLLEDNLILAIELSNVYIC